MADHGSYNITTLNRTKKQNKMKKIKINRKKQKKKKSKMLARIILQTHLGYILKMTSCFNRV